MNKYHICKNIKIGDHGYKVGDKVMLNNDSTFKYEMMYKFPFDITQCLNNGTVKIQCGEKTIRYNIRCIKPYKYDTNVDDTISEN